MIWTIVSQKIDHDNDSILCVLLDHFPFQCIFLRDQTAHIAAFFQAAVGVRVSNTQITKRTNTIARIAQSYGVAPVTLSRAVR